MSVSFFLRDARYFQIVFQGVFLLYGILFLHWHGQEILFITYFGVCLFTQFVCEYFLGRKQYTIATRLKNVLPSAMITALGLCLLLKTDEPSIAALAACIAIASKYLLKINGKHIFNPSALGIIAVVYLTDSAWLSPGQWGNGIVILFAATCLGFIVLTRIQKLDVSLSFLGTFGGLLFIRQIIYLGWPLDFFIQSISTGSLLLFTFFMITDPKTMPDNPVARLLWCIAIGIAAFYLNTFHFMSTAPILVLILAQPLVPLIDHFCKGKQFNWHYSQPEKIFIKKWKPV